MSRAESEHFAHRARLEKARRLVNVIDLYAVTEEKIDPLLNADAVVIGILDRLSDGAWQMFAQAARVNPPGPASRAIVRQTYLDRARCAKGERVETAYSYRQPRVTL
ncbi:MAG TPA: hypothetical protein VGK73_06815 [Polyangiaceae bacterium]